MFHLTVGILLLPIVSQLFLGSFSIAEKIRLRYTLITRINSFCQIVLFFAAPKLIDLEARIEHVHAIMPRTTFTTLNIFLFLLFIGVIACQLVWKKGQGRRFKKDKALADD